MCQCFRPIRSFADCWLLSVCRALRHSRSPVCENVSRKKMEFFSSIQHDVTPMSDKAARYKLKCMAKHWRDYGVGITHSHVRFIWIRHLANGHILYTHLSGPTWIALFGEILRSNFGYRERIPRHFAVSMGSLNSVIQWLIKPIRSWFMRGFPWKHLSLLGKTRNHQRHMSRNRSIFSCSRLEWIFCQLFFPLINAKLSIKMQRGNELANCQFSMIQQWILRNFPFPSLGAFL